MVSLESLHPQQQLPLQDRALLYRPSSYVPTMDSPAIYDQQQHQQHQPGAFSSVYYPNLPQQQPLYLATFPQDDFTTAPNYSALGHFPAEPVAQPPPLSYSPVVFQQPQLPPQQLQQPVLTVAQLQEMLLPLYRAHFPDSSIPTALPAILSHLLFVTRYLALNVVDLGLASDSLLSYDSRLQFWRLFNRTWINLLARAHNTHATANIVALSRFQLDECAVDIVALADNLQQYGLVDYELGVWEDRIIEWIMTLLNSIPE
ncbi:hypothetical protein BZA70DRAFT_47371 [Myxozyma melibiosi]|uniref:Uncharacterized protein n=1 Tax=Myxozyma melibiosi TaxID=54550 RepID=A0ABR1FEU2_9ASCO